MPIHIRRESVQDVGEMVQVTITDEQSGGRITTILKVQPGATVLALTATASGPDGENHSPRNTNVRLRDPAGRDVAMTAQGDPAGRQALLLQNPIPGTWTIDVEYGGAASAEVSAAALKKGWLAKLRASATWFSCKTCKMALRTLVVSTLVHLGPLVAAGIAAKGALAVLAALKPIAVQILTETFTFSAGGVPQFLSICLSYIGKPVDNLMQQICRWLGLCP